MKITMENQKILQRLQQRTSCYNVTNWAKENEKRKKLISNICEYPYQFDMGVDNREIPQPPATANAGLYGSLDGTQQPTYVNGPPDFVIKKGGKGR